jgi:hypothetical protein
MKNIAFIVIVSLPPLGFLFGDNEDVMLEKALHDGFGKFLIGIYLTISATLIFGLIKELIRFVSSTIRK